MLRRTLFLVAGMVLGVNGFAQAQNLIQITDTQTWQDFGTGGFGPGDTLQIMAGGDLTVTARSRLREGRHLIVEEGGRFTINARMDMDSEGELTMNGGEFHNTVDFKFPDSSGDQDVHIWLYGGLMVCESIQSMQDRGSVLHVGGGVLRVGNAANGDQYDPENTDAWAIVAIPPYPEVSITNLGDGWKEISAGSPFEAYGPEPADGATDVVRDPILNWIPAVLAVTHDVYLGVDLESVSNADRQNPLGVLVAEGLDISHFSPSPLEYGRTYYWRIDEVNDADPTGPWKGTVWSFTAEPYSYPIEAITPVASSSLKPDLGPHRTADGSGLNDGDAHSSDMSDMWVSDVEAGDAWIQYAFDTVRKLDRMVVWNFNAAFESVLGWGLRDVTVETSENGTDWVVLKSVEFSQGSSEDDYLPNTIVDLGGVLASSVRLTAQSNWGDLIRLYGLSEVRFLNVVGWAREPQPSDGAEGVDPDSMLAWRAGREAASHQVYLGTDVSQMVPADTLSQTSYNLANLDLELGRTYFWRIDEVNDLEIPAIWEGDIWTFSTQEFLTVEDFESYADDEGSRIYETWIDGWEVSENGSQVGYDQAPFAEQTIVHGGRQSMPLAYDNTAATYSEAERTFDVPQDWTAHGATMLLLFFRGQAVNTPAQLYLKIDGTRVDYTGAADDLTKEEWMPFSVDLSSLGLDPRNVRKLCIGIEGGAAGRLLVDDIRLTKP